MKFSSILTHEDIVIEPQYPLRDQNDLEEFLNSAKFSDAFPKTSPNFAGLPNDSTQALVRLGNISHDILLHAFQNSSPVENDVVGLINRTALANRPYGNANAFASMETHMPIVVILAGLVDLAMFFNSIFYVLANYVDGRNRHREIWHIYLKFIIGKVQNNYFLPWIWNDMGDEQMYDYAAFNSTHAVCFSYLHEYGHIRLKHKKKYGTESIQQEFAADAAAIELLENKDLGLFMALEFFKLFEFLDYLEIESDHPYCHKRLLQLYDTYKERMDSEIRVRYEFHIKKMRKIFQIFDRGRRLPPTNKFMAWILMTFGNWKPFPNMVDLADYEASKNRLYALIRSGMQNRS